MLRKNCRVRITVIRNRHIVRTSQDYRALHDLNLTRIRGGLTVRGIGIVRDSGRHRGGSKGIARNCRRGVISIWNKRKVSCRIIRPRYSFVLGQRTRKGQHLAVAVPQRSRTGKRECRWCVLYYDGGVCRNRTPVGVRDVHVVVRRVRRIGTYRSCICGTQPYARNPLIRIGVQCGNHCSCQRDRIIRTLGSRRIHRHRVFCRYCAIDRIYR